MRRGERFPDDQAHIVFTDVFVEYLEELTHKQREDILVEVVRLCQNAAGTHGLSNRSTDSSLAGWNTLYALGDHHRVVFSSRVVKGVGLIEVLCAGPRKGSAVYDMAAALRRSGRLTDAEFTEIWQALALLDVVAENVDLDGWDFAPPPAPEGQVRAAVAAGLLDEAIARVLSKHELEAAMSEGWTATGPDPQAALSAAMRAARTGVDFGDLTRILRGRLADRCDAILPRAGSRCIRRAQHPGPHRSAP